MNDRVGDTPVVVLHDAQAAATAAYERTVDGRVLEFEPSVSEGKIRDRTTGSTWCALRGDAVEGPPPVLHPYTFTELPPPAGRGNPAGERGRCR